MDGVVFSKNMEELIFCPCAKEGKYQIPESVKTIGFGAFNGCSKLTEIIIPDGIKEIKDETFENCTALEKVVLPEGIVMIESRAFKGCISLKEITLPQSVYKIGMLTFAENTVVICTPDIFKKLPITCNYCAK